MRTLKICTIIAQSLDRKINKVGVMKSSKIIFTGLFIILISEISMPAQSPGSSYHTPPGTGGGEI